MQKIGTSYLYPLVSKDIYMVLFINFSPAALNIANPSSIDKTLVNVNIINKTIR